MGAVATAKTHFQQLFLFTSVFIRLALVKLLTEKKKKKKKKANFLRRICCPRAVYIICYLEAVL